MKFGDSMSFFHEVIAPEKQYLESDEIVFQKSLHFTIFKLVHFQYVVLYIL